MRTVIRVFGSGDAMAIPGSWSVWTYQGITYRRVDDVIFATFDDRLFVWSDDGTRWGWRPTAAPDVLSTSPLVDRVVSGW